MNKKIGFCLAIFAIMLVAAGCSSPAKIQAPAVDNNEPPSFSVSQTPVPSRTPVPVPVAVPTPPVLLATSTAASTSVAIPPPAK